MDSYWTPTFFHPAKVPPIVASFPSRKFMLGKGTAVLGSRFITSFGAQHRLLLPAWIPPNAPIPVTDPRRPPSRRTARSLAARPKGWCLSCSFTLPASEMAPEPHA